MLANSDEQIVMRDDVTESGSKTQNNGNIESLLSGHEDQTHTTHTTNTTHAHMYIHSCGPRQRNIRTNSPGWKQNLCHPGKQQRNLQLYMWRLKKMKQKEWPKIFFAKIHKIYQFTELSSQ